MRKTPDAFRSVLIVGGAGFIGSNWAHHLLVHTDAKVHIFDNLSRYGVRHNLQALQKTAGRSGRLQITIGDVRDAAMVQRAARVATEIYHFAAQVAVTTSIADPRLDFETNVIGTFNVLEAARRSSRPPFVLFTSTNKVYGDMGEESVEADSHRYRHRNGGGVAEDQPLDFCSPYGCSKGAADQYVHDYARTYGLPTVVLRMSCIAGPRQFGNEDQGWVAHFLYSALTGKPVVIYGDGRQVRDVLCVDDLLCAFEAVRQVQAEGQGQIYNVGGGPRNTISLLELMACIRELTRRPVEYLFDQRRPGDQLVYVTDISKLERATGWIPQCSVPETLKRIYDWWKHNRELFAPPVAVLPRVAAAGLQEIPEAAA